MKPQISRLVTALISLTLLCMTSGFAQEAPRSPHGSRLTIETDIDSAIVFLDGVKKGSGLMTLENLEPGRYSLRILDPAIESWYARSVVDSITLGSGEDRRLKYSLLPPILVESIPFGASVVAADTVLGETPTLVPPSMGHIRLEKNGYEPVSLTLNPSHGGSQHAFLKPLWNTESEESRIYRPVNGTDPKSLRLYITGGTAILTGATAAILKIRADTRYQEYRVTRNPALLKQTRRLDVGSAIALIATQVSLGLFTYFILSD